MRALRNLIGFRQARPLCVAACLAVLAALQFALIEVRHDYFGRGAPVQISLTVGAVLFSLGMLAFAGAASAYSRQRVEPVRFLRFVELYLITSLIILAPLGAANLWLMSASRPPLESLALAAKIAQVVCFAVLVVVEADASPLKGVGRIFG